MDQVQEGHKLINQKVQESITKYKSSIDKKTRVIKFEEKDFVWAILTKEWFSMVEYNKMAMDPVEIIVKINPNAF
jgi:hypothetical protein